MSKKYCMVWLLLCFSVFCFAVENPEKTSVSPADIPMMKLNTIADVFGFPAEVFTVRGPEAWQDDVIFRYPSGMDLYISGGIVWQVRLLKEDAGSISGIHVGSPRAEVEAALPSVSAVYEDSSVYKIEGKGYPTGIHIFWDKTGEKAADIYIFRADY